jgi:membrane-bound serine protease (ClpP class)
VWAEEAVRKSVNVTEQEALKLKVIDVVAEDVESLLAAVDGRTVETAAGKRTLATKKAEVNAAPLSWRLRLLNALIDPNVAYILMLLGTYGLLYELMSPGAILPGVVGAICLVLALYAFQTLPINYAGLLLILLAIVMFIAEIKITSYGLLTVGGVIAMFLGSVMLMKSDLPYMRISLKVIIPSVLGTALFFLFVVGMAARTFGAKPVTGREEMIGGHGIARSDLAPNGTVFVRGELWTARSDEPIRDGDMVEVTGMDGLTLQVKRAANAPAKEA